MVGVGVGYPEWSNFYLGYISGGKKSEGPTRQARGSVDFQKKKT